MSNIPGVKNKTLVGSRLISRHEQTRSVTPFIWDPFLLASLTSSFSWAPLPSEGWNSLGRCSGSPSPRPLLDGFLYQSPSLRTLSGENFHRRMAHACESPLTSPSRCCEAIFKSPRPKETLNFFLKTQPFSFSIKVTGEPLILSAGGCPSSISPTWLQPRAPTVCQELSEALNINQKTRQKVPALELAASMGNTDHDGITKRDRRTRWFVRCGENQRFRTENDGGAAPGHAPH